MKSMQLIDKKRVLNIVTAMNIIGYSKDPYVGTHKITGKVLYGQAIISR